MNLEAFQLSGALHVADGSVGFNAHYRGRGEILYSAKLCFCFHCTFIDQLFSQGPLTVTCREESGLLLRIRWLCDSISFSHCAAFPPRTAQNALRRPLRTTRVVRRWCLRLQMRQKWSFICLNESKWRDCSVATSGNYHSFFSPRLGR